MDIINMDKRNQRLISALAGLLLLLSLIYIGKEVTWYATGGSAERGNAKCVVIDPGHGGDDPGKIGINGAKEKDINLQIAL